MKTQNPIPRIICPKTMAGRLPTACARRLLPLLLLLALPAVVQAQFTYTTNNGTIAITGYTGSGGAVTIPGAFNGFPVTSIADQAFWFCTSLTSVTLGTNVATVGSLAFGNCTSLTNVTLGTNVTSILTDAFRDCYSLANLAIPDGVTNIGEGAFGGCTKLGAISVNASNPAYTSVAGVLFNKSQTMLIQYPAGQGGGYTIPNTVTSIGDEAFEACISLTSVAIPNSVTSIGSYAFFNCTRLTNVTLGTNLTRIDDHAFYTCTSLTGITIPNSVTSIGNGAFGSCSSLTSVTIPNSVTNIASPVFLDCSSLTVITVNAANPVYSSVAGVLFNKSQTMLIQYPAGKAGGYTIPNAVTGIGATAFEDCTGLTSVTIPASVASYGDDAFYGCTSLTGVYFQGNAPSVGADVFAGENDAIAYYLPGTTGWGATFDGLPTRLWLPLPGILAPPLTQTAETGTVAWFFVEVTNTPPEPTYYQWYFGGTNALAGATNSYIDVTNVQPVQAGAYTVVVTNLYGAVTSDPALLSVILPVERRVVPAVGLPGGNGSLLHLEYAESLVPAPAWSSLTNVTLGSGPQFCFDLSQPLPAQRFYRSWQTNGPQPVLDMSMATEIALTGAIGSSVQIDYINVYGPTNAWVALDTVILTNTMQLYFDVTMFRRPTRLYRLVGSP
jgi:hypothetical protein